jgi:glycosyltransferase involved in cell wall biosynthesis
MNILVFSWRDPKHPLAGGAEQVMHEHMKGWVKAGHQVTLFSSHFKGGARKEKLDGILIVRYGYQLLGVHLAGFFWYFFGKHKKFDLVVDQFHGIPFFTPFYVRAPKLAVLQEVAREVWFVNHLPKPFNWIVGWLGYLGEPFVFLFYRRIPFMVGSKSAKKDLIKFRIPSKNITIIPHGVIIERAKVKAQKSKIKTIIFLGALAKDKGIEDAIRTFAILNREGRFQFWVVGKGSKKYLDELVKLARKLGLQKKIKFWGFVSQKKKFEFLRRAHVMINPSIREGWGLVNIEANAMATPVVAYNSPGLVDSVKEGQSGIICRKNTPREMANQVFNLLNNKALYNKLQKGAISWSKNFSWKKSKKKSLDLITSIIS